ncbi:LytR/AlgR family response regulator transcription factor [Aquimarina litoralis]|uniref:LytR/AlgR family response regulator transcription factor n=1 Tax=Aquimarina litoralis TaxID=584605 RepID=UPI001C5990A3|nr:LytTR family DNA-binding domain-containing protein [Aquimarina litoralis]MBW1297012.1 response regulator [Aquimarina litoralis]
MDPIKTVIIEDESTARDHLVKLISQLDTDIVVTTMLATVQDSVEWLKNHEHPDLIFMDIQLSDGLSFEILDAVSIAVPIIFITAYDAYAVKAFKTTGIDYLLKPLSLEDLQQAIQQYQQQHTYQEERVLRHVDITQLLKQPNAPQYKERFLLRSGTSMIPVTTKDIAYFYRDELVFAKLWDNQLFPLDDSLQQLQSVLDPRIFVRLNRQLLVNIQAIDKLVPAKPGQVSVILHPPFDTEIQLSPERSRWLKQVLDGNW